MESEQSNHKPPGVVVGVIPPPFGGVLVHVRYMELLRLSGVDATLHEQTGKEDPENRVVSFANLPLKFVGFLLKFEEDVVHFYFNNHRALVIAGQV